MLKAFGKIVGVFPSFWANWMTLLGTVITTISGFSILVSLVVTLVAGGANQYALAVGVLVMPAMFIGGLILTSIGFIYETRRKEGRRDQGPVDNAFREAFRLAMQSRRARGLIIFFALATLVNVVLIGGAVTTALSFMDSPKFCGEFCHTVMQPEYDTYRQSPHSRVKCVQCHIGPGASWAVKAKVDGLRQVWGVMTGNYSTPIPSPVRELRPARDTCQQCHWPSHFLGNRISFFTHFDDDEENSPSVTALMLKVGGMSPKTGKFHGIHWHVSDEVEIRYEALDEKREKVGRVQVYEKGELVREYLPPKEEASGSPVEVRTMDCVDCHNRPTHVFDQSPKLAVDRAMFQGLLNREQPYLHKAAVAVLEAAGGDLERDKAEEHFDAALAAYYEKEFPDTELSAEERAKAADGLAKLYHLNIYPDMKIVWGVHPNHLGHRGEEQDKRGCFRCHNDEHESSDGKVIAMDCDLCHDFLEEEVAPDELPEGLRSLLPEF